MTGRWTRHGGGLAAARRHFGEGPDAWIDLSTGINPRGWPGASEQAIDWQRLPGEEELRALEHVAALHFGVSASHVCAMPGTEAGMRLLGTMLPGPAFYAIPSYRTHGEMIAGAQPLPADRLDEAAGATLILANPNNPDGRVLDRPALLTLLHQRGKEGWLLLDEAFADAIPHLSLAEGIAEDKRLLIFRSFGKFFGLAGVRLGFLLGPASFIARMRERLGSWPLHAAALAIGAAAYADSAWITATRAALMRDSTRLDELLRRHGLAPIGQCPLFRLIETEKAATLFDHLARRQILTRPFAENPRWLRFGLPGDEAAWQRLDKALGDG